LRAADTALSADLELLTQAVRDAGALAFGKFRAKFKSWTKEGNSPVSEVDIACNDLLHDRLAPCGYGWLSEESVDDPARLKAERVWIIDPIDGTRSFIAGKEDWCVSAALVERGRPILGVIFGPAENTLLQARAGHGVLLNGAAVKAAPREHKRIRAAGPPRWLDALTDARQDIQPMPKVYSLALRIARVATDDLDVAIAGRNASDWDIAAADLIVHEAGGRFTGLDGEPIQYNRPTPTHPMLLAARSDLHTDIAALLHKSN
jgi:myo-inositol-1(or 4)-monophosphatase